jgi:hypothetical protein
VDFARGSVESWAVGLIMAPRAGRLPLPLVLGLLLVPWGALDAPLRPGAGLVDAFSCAIGPKVRTSSSGRRKITASRCTAS